MKLCYVAMECSPYTGGGIGTYVANVVRAMAAAGHEVDLVTDVVPEADVPRLADLGVRVLPLPARRTVTPGYWSWWHAYADAVHHTLREHGRRRPWDVIEFTEFAAPGFTTLRAKRLLGEFADTRLVVKLHTPSWLLNKLNHLRHYSPVQAVDTYLEDYSVRQADIVTSPSASLAELTCERFPGLSVRPSPYPLALPPSSGPPSAPDPDRVVFVGRLEHRKGVDLLVHAIEPLLRRRAELHLHCYGGDTATAPLGQSMRDDLLARVIPPDLTERIHLAGQAPYEDVLASMASAAVCVFPSRWENWPNVCLEAMSQGAVVVASRHGGMSQMIEHERDGFLVDPFDTRAFGETIEHAVQNNDRLGPMREQARARAAQLCDYAACAEAIADSYAAPETPRPSERPTDSPPVSVLVAPSDDRAMVETTLQSVTSSRYPIAEADASSEFVLALRAGVLLSPEAVEQAANALANTPELACVSCHVACEDHTESGHRPVGVVPELLFFWNPAGNGCTLWRRAALDELGAGADRLTEYEQRGLICRLAESRWQADVLPTAECRFAGPPAAALPTDQIPFAQRLVAEHPDLAARVGERALQIGLGLWLHHAELAQWREVQAAGWERQAEDAQQRTLGALPRRFGRAVRTLCRRLFGRPPEEIDTR